MIIWWFPHCLWYERDPETGTYELEQAIFDLYYLAGRNLALMDIDNDGLDDLLSLGDNWNLSYWRNTTQVAVEDDDIPAPELTLTAYPNPFNPETALRFSLDKPGKVHLSVCNIRGQCVATLMNKAVDSGAHEVTWNTHGLASGIFLVRLRSSQGECVIRLVLLQ